MRSAYRLSKLWMRFKDLKTSKKRIRGFELVWDPNQGYYGWEWGVSREKSKSSCYIPNYIPKKPHQLVKHRYKWIPHQTFQKTTYISAFLATSWKWRPNRSSMVSHFTSNFKNHSNMWNSIIGGSWCCC